MKVCNYLHAYRYEQIDHRTKLDSGSVEPAEFDRFSLRRGDVVVTKDSEDRFDIGVPTVIADEFDDLVCGYHLAILRPRPDQIYPQVLAGALQLPAVRNELASRANGVTRFGLTLRDLGDTLIPLPPRYVQDRIVEVASQWAQEERRLLQIASAKQKRMRGLLEQLCTGRRRLADHESCGWSIVKLGALFHSRKENGHDGLAVRSVTLRNGLVDRITLERKTESSLSPREHLLARKGDIVYNMMRMWQGASGVAESDAIVSPAYVVLQPTCLVDSLFAAFWFKSNRMVHLFWAYSHGLTDDRLRLYAKDFSMIPVMVPENVDEQRAIAEVLKTAQQEIGWLKQLRELIRKQKRGLMQKLLTGQIRVPIAQPESADRSPA